MGLLLQPPPPHSLGLGCGHQLVVLRALGTILRSPVLTPTLQPQSSCPTPIPGAPPRPGTDAGPAPQAGQNLSWSSRLRGSPVRPRVRARRQGHQGRSSCHTPQVLGLGQPCRPRTTERDWSPEWIKVFTGSRQPLPSLGPTHFTRCCYCSTDEELLGHTVGRMTCLPAAPRTHPGPSPPPSSAP